MRQGTRLEKLEQRLPTDAPEMTCFCSGDYATDEEMERAIEEWKLAHPNHLEPLVVYVERDVEDEDNG